MLCIFFRETIIDKLAVGIYSPTAIYAGIEIGFISAIARDISCRMLICSGSMYGIRIISKPFDMVAVSVYDTSTIYTVVIIFFIAAPARFVIGSIVFSTGCVLVGFSRKPIKNVAVRIYNAVTVYAKIVIGFIAAATRSVVGIIHFTCRHMRSCREFDGFKHIVIFVQIAVAIRAMVIGDIAGVGTGRLLRFYEFLVFMCARVYRCRFGRRVCETLGFRGGVFCELYIIGGGNR